MQEAVIDRVMRTYGLMNTVSDAQLEHTRELLLDFLSKRPDTDEHKAAVEGLAFLRNLKT